MSAPTALTGWTATELAAGIRAGRVSATEVVGAHLDRIEALDPRLNAVVLRDDDRARLAAAALDAALAAGRPVGPLAGVPVTVKEAFDVAGLASTCGMAEHLGRVAGADAPAVARLRAAGAVILGKTNVPVQLADLQSDNPIYGRTVNPWDPERTCGGSSGGSAAAVAAGFAALDLGSDLSGSIRVPAAWCGVFGLRPSNGLISKRGHLPWPPDGQLEPPMSVAGPLARSAADLGLALGVLAPALARPFASRRHPGAGGGLGGVDVTGLGGRPRRGPADRPRRVAIWTEAAGAPVDRETSAALGVVRAALERAGWETVDFAAPFRPEEALEVTWRLVFAEIVGGLSAGQWEAVAAGAPDLRQHLADLERRAAMAQQWEDALRRFDGLLCPAVPVVALRHDARPTEARVVDVDGHPFTHQDLASWSLLASVGQGPSVTLPAGVGAASGMPVGLQLVGRRGSDAAAVELSGDVDRVLGRPLRPWAP
jgi:amidase